MSVAMLDIRYIYAWRTSSTRNMASYQTRNAAYACCRRIKIWPPTKIEPAVWRRHMFIAPVCASMPKYASIVAAIIERGCGADCRALLDLSMTTIDAFIKWRDYINNYYIHHAGFETLENIIETTLKPAIFIIITLATGENHLRSCHYYFGASSAERRPAVLL